MFIASVRPSVCLSVCLKPKFGRLKTKFDDDAKTKFGPAFYVFYMTVVGELSYKVLSSGILSCQKIL